MLLLRKEKLPQGPDWLYEIKLDGYRTLAIKSEGEVRLWSRTERRPRAANSGFDLARTALKRSRSTHSGTAASVANTRACLQRPCAKRQTTFSS